MAGQHLPIFIHDLAVILVTAGATSILFKWLKQPVILGYLVAGLLVGPSLPIFPRVTDLDNIKLWGEIGVLFVLFSLGLEFSFRRLLRVGGGAVSTAVVETTLVFCLGALVAVLLGWKSIDAIFWGGMLSISSTTIIFKVFEEKGLKGRHFAQLVMGILIVEDLVAVLLLVLLSTVALTREVSGVELIGSAGRLIFFLILWFVVGLFALPAIMRSIRKLLTEETTLIFAVGLCLLMVLIATKVGFSPALGAFVMGSLLAETVEGSRIEKLLHPLRDFFAAIFFVSVGMLLDLRSVSEIWPLILLMSAVLFMAKTVFVSIGAVASGQSLNTSIRAGLSLTQIGEFSFIIASLGMSLGVISPNLYPLAVGVSLLTSFTTPFAIRSADFLVPWIEGAMPKAIREPLAAYQALIERQSSGRMGIVLVRAYLPLVIVNLVLYFSVSWLARHLIYPRLQEIFGAASWLSAMALVLDLLLCSPFLYGLMLQRPNRRYRAQLAEIPRAKWVQNAITALRMILGSVLTLLVVAQYVSWKTFSGLLLVSLMAALFIFWRFGKSFYRRLESRFFEQFKETPSERPEGPLLPWDHHLSEVLVAADSPLVGMTLGQIGPQESFGVMVAAIHRGRRRILAPKAGDQIFPGDRLKVIGADEGVERIRRLAELTEPPMIDELPLTLQCIVLEPNSPLCGKTLRESSIREKVDGLVVGLERDNSRQIHPPADFHLQAGDRLWIVGDPDKFPRLNQKK